MSEPNPDVLEMTDVPLNAVELELGKRMRSLHAQDGSPIQKARMSNLIIYCDDESHAAQVEAMIPGIVTTHPARVFLLVADETSKSAEVKASVLVRRAGQGSRMAAEQITLRGGSHAAERLTFAVRPLVISDLPTNVWWASPKPPPLAGPVLDDLCEHAQQLIYDSLGWTAPHQGIAAASTWLRGFERGGEGGRWRVASDLNWRRLKYWRRLISQELSPAIHPGALDSVTEILIEHGPHAVTQAWLLAAWMSSRLGWKIQATRFKVGTEIAFHIIAPHGTLRLRMDRLPEGPNRIERVHIACSVGGKMGSLDFVAMENGRLAVQPEGIDAAPRTITLPAFEIADFVAKQLSDREPDVVFRETVKSAQVLAQALFH